MIRPHPLNLKIWEGFNRKGAVIVPRDNRDIFYSTEAKALFFESFYHSKCVIGLNTTAMIEAAIVDKPCMSIIDGRYSATQENSGHFHHLIDAGILYTANNIADAAAMLDRVLAGDTKVEDRRCFVRDFIRPCGLEKPASEIMIKVLVGLASKISPQVLKKEMKDF